MRSAVTELTHFTIMGRFGNTWRTYKNTLLETRKKVNERKVGESMSWKCPEKVKVQQIRCERKICPSHFMSGAWPDFPAFVSLFGCLLEPQKCQRWNACADAPSLPCLVHTQQSNSVEWPYFSLAMHMRWRMEWPWNGERKEGKKEDVAKCLPPRIGFPGRNRTREHAATSEYTRPRMNQLARSVRDGWHEN